VLLAVGAISMLTRRDRRLIFRDDIADAVGSPVIASVHTGTMRTAADWMSLLSDYTPGTIDAWAMRQALRQLMVLEPPTQGGTHGARARTDYPASITVVTMSADPRGLATGPQLAAYAASVGIRTHLSAAQPHETSATLWAACASMEQGQTPRAGLSVDTQRHDVLLAELTVVLAVLDRQEPKLLDVPAGTVVVLALSAGSATAEELARLAVTVDEAGELISGVVVADPDNLDRTTGRLLQHDRLHQVPLPTRLTGGRRPRPPRGAGRTTEGGRR
jgi:hypothetical protein